MADICGICEEVLGEQPRTELLCHHVFHTNCVFTNIANAQMHLNVRCVTCDNHIFPEEEEEEEEEADNEEEDNQSVASAHSRSTRVQNLYETNARFRKDIKYYAHICRSIHNPKRELQKLIREKKEELAEPWALIRARYEGLFNVKKDEIQQSEQYKAYRSVDRKLFSGYYALQRRYNIVRTDLGALHTNPGLRSLKAPNRWRYYTRPSSMIRRGLRLTLPRY